MHQLPFIVQGKRKDGSHWWVDGYKRYLALKAQGIEDIPYIIFKSDGEEHERAMRQLLHCNGQPFSDNLVEVALWMSKYKWN